MEKAQRLITTKSEKQMENFIPPPKENSLRKFVNLEKLSNIEHKHFEDYNLAEFDSSEEEKPDKKPVKKKTGKTKTNSPKIRAHLSTTRKNRNNH